MVVLPLHYPTTSFALTGLRNYGDCFNQLDHGDQRVFRAVCKVRCLNLSRFILLLTIFLPRLVTSASALFSADESQVIARALG
jgi:hypothetical protein